MKVLFCTREYPPYVYGGAGVHVEYLASELSRLMDIEVRSFGDQDLEDGQLKVLGFESGELASTIQNRNLLPSLKR